MKDKGKLEIFLSKSVSLAIEMVRACLRPTNMNLEGRWEQMNIASDLIGDAEFGERDILFEILIYPGTKIAAHCSVVCMDGEWKEGTVSIKLLDSTSQERSGADWKFHCKLDAQGRINAQMTQ